MKNILLLLSIMFFANRITFAEKDNNLFFKKTINSNIDYRLEISNQAKHTQVWQCWSYTVEGCCGLNGTACANTYADVVSIIESTILNFCPTCSCEV